MKSSSTMKSPAGMKSVSTTEGWILFHLRQRRRFHQRWLISSLRQQGFHFHLFRKLKISLRLRPRFHSVRNDSFSALAVFPYSMYSLYSSKQLSGLSDSCRRIMNSEKDERRRYHALDPARHLPYQIQATLLRVARDRPSVFGGAGPVLREILLLF